MMQYGRQRRQNITARRWTPRRAGGEVAVNTEQVQQLKEYVDAKFRDALQTVSYEAEVR